MSSNIFSGKKVLITGGFGFTGSNLARRLVNCGAEVSLLKRESDDKKNVEDIINKVKIIAGDVRDYEKIEESIKEKDYIFHLASQSSVPVSMENPFLDLDTNCKATLNLLESCRKINKNAKIIFAGTIREAGQIEGTYANEEQREFPTSIVDLHKLASEKYLQIYHKVYGLNTTTLRFSNIFGPGQYVTHPHKSVINHIIKKVLSDKKIEVYGDGGPLRDYNYVENVVDACLNAAQSPNTAGGYYIIGSGEGNTFKDFLEKLKKLVMEMYGFSIEIKKIETPEIISKTSQGSVIADYKKFNKATGWMPKINFENGIRKTADFYYKNLDIQS